MGVGSHTLCELASWTVCVLVPLLDLRRGIPPTGEGHEAFPRMRLDNKFNIDLYLLAFPNGMRILYLADCRLYSSQSFSWIQSPSESIRPKKSQATFFRRCSYLRTDSPSKRRFAMKMVFSPKNSLSLMNMCIEE